MTTHIAPDVPIPPGARPDTWQEDVPQPYRILLGDVRGIDGRDIDHVSVQPTAVQFADGRIDDGGVHEPPHVYLRDDGLTAMQARELAALLVEAALQDGRRAGDCADLQQPRLTVGSQRIRTRLGRTAAGNT
jgi:hypothetical protein